MMKQVGTSFFAALKDLFRGRFLLVMLLPVSCLVLVLSAVGWLFWDDVTGVAMQWLSELSVIQFMTAKMGDWMGAQGWLGAATSALLLLVLLLMALLVVVLVSMVLASTLLAPWVADDVAKRHYPGVARQGDMGFWQSLKWTLQAFAHTVLLLLVSLPLWFIPFMPLVLPPLVVGWFNSRVMGLDVLSAFASRQELQQVLREQRVPMLIMGMAAGFLGVAPALTWASGVVFAALFAVLIPLAVFIYMAVLVFTALWFSHFALNALHLQRIKKDSMDVFSMKNERK